MSETNNTTSAFTQRTVEILGDNASFLALIRSLAVRKPNYDISDLVELEARMDANLDGLLASGSLGMRVAEELAEYNEFGEVFILHWLMYKSWSDLQQRFIDVLEDEGAYRPLVSALAWRPLEQSVGLIESLLSDEDPRCYWLAINLCSVYRHDPGEALLWQFDLLEAPSARRARALRACGELNRADILPQLRGIYRDPDPACSFWALWSGALLGDRTTLASLQTFVVTPSEFSETAMAILMRLLSQEAQAEILQYLAANPKTERLAVMGAGWSGDISWIPGLLARMDDNALARVSGEAFSMLTGADLKYLDLDRDQPDNFQSGPTDDPQDEDVSLDRDEDLPWPDTALVAAWWQQQSSNYEPSERYLCGRIISRKSCYEVLLKGYQRQRHSAALELCLLGEGLFPTSAPAKMQKALLAGKASE